MKAISVKNRMSSRHLRYFRRKGIDDLLARYRTPFLMLSRNRIAANLRRLRGALPGVEVYYAVKANNHPAILDMLMSHSARFDISSSRELREVLSLGGTPEEMLHSNPIKSIHEFDEAVGLGIRLFVADNIAELEKFTRYDGKAGVLIRVITDSSASVVNLSRKFGAQPAEIPALLDRVAELKIPFGGFCFHVGSQCTDPDKYVQAIETAREMIELANVRGLATEILDIGGGFPIEYTAKIPAIEKIGAKVTAALRDNIPPSIRVLAEPGRYICGDAGCLVTAVIGKSVRDGVKWYYLDDGLYGSFSGRLFDHCSYRILTNRNTIWEQAVLAGPTCDSFDVIYDNCLLPPLEIGDTLLFPAMGAYCSVSATDFNGLEKAQVIIVD
jgi:ornithine decarboxylase